MNNWNQCGKWSPPLSRQKIAVSCYKTNRPSKWCYEYQYSWNLCGFFPKNRFYPLSFIVFLKEFKIARIGKNDIHINRSNHGIIYFQGWFKSAKFDSRFKHKQVKTMKIQNITIAQKLLVSKQTISNFNGKETFTSHKFFTTTIDTRFGLWF